MSKNKKRRAKKRELAKNNKKEIMKKLNSQNITYDKAFELLDELKSEN